MRRKWFNVGILVALTGACLWFTPSTAEAQRRGRGWGWGNSGMYVSPGGVTWGNPGYYRGYDRGYWDRGYYPRYSYYGSRPWYSDSYYWSPSYRYSYPSTAYYYPSTSYSYPSTTYSAPQTVYYEAETSTPSTARIMVRVPSSNAEVWLDGQPTSQSGMERTFMTPRLNSGSTYTYEVKARWMENGQPVEQTRTVRFQPGQTVNVDFTRSS